MTEPTAADDKDEAQQELSDVRIPLGVYQHWHGPHYVVYGMSVSEETLDVLVHYYSLEKNSRWTRTITDFMYPVFWQNDITRPRFCFRRKATPQEMAGAMGDELVAALAAAKGVLQ